jgi:ComF family protein
MQSVLKVLYPPQCISCGAHVEDSAALCGRCWHDTPFLGGAVCDACGAPLLGAQSDGQALCDQCLTLARPWSRGRAALAYRDNARRLVLALKHGDRMDLALPAARWMARAGAPFLRQGMLAVPVPVHRWRLLKRRYNQAAVLAQALARVASLDYAPDALVRLRGTRVQDGMSQDERFRNLEGAIAPHPKRGARLRSADIVLVDDVMTSGATLAASAEAALAAGAREVCVLVLARVAKDP